MNLNMIQASCGKLYGSSTYGVNKKQWEEKILDERGFLSVCFTGHLRQFWLASFAFM